MDTTNDDAKYLEETLLSCISVFLNFGLFAFLPWLKYKPHNINFILPLIVSWKVQKYIIFSEESFNKLKKQINS